MVLAPIILPLPTDNRTNDLVWRFSLHIGATNNIRRTGCSSAVEYLFAAVEEEYRWFATCGSQRDHLQS
jgi:hypothetical protein